MNEFKVGDKVMLRPETKPYTFMWIKDIPMKKIENTSECDELIVRDLDAIGNIRIEDSNNVVSKILPHHLKHANQDYNDNPYRFEYAVGGFDNPRSRTEDLQEFKITPYDNEELRFMIYHGNPSRTLEEMQAIEKWLLNK